MEGSLRFGQDLTQFRQGGDVRRKRRGERDRWESVRSEEGLRLSVGFAIALGLRKVPPPVRQDLMGGPLPEKVECKGGKEQQRVMRMSLLR